MKILEILSLLEYAPGQMQTYFHVTPHTRLKSILEKGLLPSKRRQWQNYMGARLGETRKLYLFSDYDQAIRFAAKLEWGLKTEKRRVTQVDILELQSDVPVEPDNNLEAQLDGGRGTWWKTSHAIPPGAIKKVTPLTLQMTRDYIARRDKQMPVVDQEGETQEPAGEPSMPPTPGDGQQRV